MYIVSSQTGCHNAIKTSMWQNSQQ